MKQIKETPKNLNKIGEYLFEIMLGSETSINPFGEDIQFQSEFFQDTTKMRNNLYEKVTCYHFKNNLPKVLYTKTFNLTKKDYEKRMNYINSK